MFQVVWYIVFNLPRSKIEFTFIILLMLYLYYCHIIYIEYLSWFVMVCMILIWVACFLSLSLNWRGNRNHSTIISNTCVRSGEDDLERLIFLKRCKNLKGLTRFSSSQFFLLVLPLKMQALNVRIIEEAVHNVHMLN